MIRLNKVLDPTLTGRDADELESSLRRKIVGQDEAIEQIVNIYQTFLAGMTSPGRPIGNFLFLGPTGSGKTRLVESAAESLVGDARAVIKIDCAEFQHSHEIAKLIGSPPGYLGHRETHPLLSQEVLNQFHSEKMKLSFVLFDEIEKASDALWNLLLGILDKATLTLGDNRRVDFSRTLIFMTSNLGAAEMGSILRPNLGFAASEIQRLQSTGELDEGHFRQDCASGCGGGAAQIYAGIHESHRQGCRIQAAGSGRTTEDPEPGVEHPAAAHLQLFDHHAVRLFVDRSRQRLSAARRHGHEIWSASSEARHRSYPGAATFEPDRDGPSPRRRFDLRGFQSGARVPGVL